MSTDNYTPTTDDLIVAWAVPGHRLREVDAQAISAIEREREARRAIGQIKAEALREAVSEFESHVGVGEFDEQTEREGCRWVHIADAWEHQGPFMDWLRNRADEIGTK